MGRTVKTTNLILQQEKAAFNNFRRTLRRADQALFDNLFAYASKHTAAISMAQVVRGAYPQRTLQVEAGIGAEQYPGGIDQPDVGTIDVAGQ